MDASPVNNNNKENTTNTSHQTPINDGESDELPLRDNKRNQLDRIQQCVDPLSLYRENAHIESDVRKTKRKPDSLASSSEEKRKDPVSPLKSIYIYKRQEENNILLNQHSVYIYRGWLAYMYTHTHT